MDDFALPIECTVEHGCRVFRVHSRIFLDDAEALQIRARIEKEIEGDDAPCVALSLDGFKVVTSAAWGKFMVLHQNIAKQGGVFVLVDVGEALIDVVESMKIRQLLDIRDSAADVGASDTPSDS